MQADVYLLLLNIFELENVFLSPSSEDWKILHESMVFSAYVVWSGWEGIRLVADRLDLKNIFDTD